MYNSDPLRLNICRTPIALTGLDAPMLREARTRYRPFLATKPSHAGFHFQVDLDDTRKLSSQYSPPRVSYQRGRRIVRIDHDTMEARLDLSRKEGKATIIRRLNVLDNILRVFFTIHLLPQRGFLCHAAGLTMGTGGILFPGASSAGKTTIARKAGVQRVLSDELPGVILQKGKPHLMGTPFWGNFRKGRLNVSVSLRAVAFLNKTAPFGCRPLPKEEALMRLMATILFFTDDPAANKQLLSTASTMVQSVPAVEFNYDKNRDTFARIKNRLREVLSDRAVEK